MISILHGDHEAQIYSELTKCIDAAKSKGADVVRLSGKKLDINLLETALGTDALFAQEKLVVIDGLFGLPKSKRKDELVKWIAQHDSSEISILLVEKKALTLPQMKQLPKAVSKQFKFPAILFSWLETIGSVPATRSIELFHGVLEHEASELCFFMLIRQVRTLLAFASDGSFDGPPFLRGKVASQAKYFSKERLLALHGKLLLLDEQQKTSKLSMSLADNLDLLLAQM